MKSEQDFWEMLAAATPEAWTAQDRANLRALLSQRGPLVRALALILRGIDAEMLEMLPRFDGDADDAAAFRRFVALGNRRKGMLGVVAQIYDLAREFPKDVPE